MLARAAHARRAELGDAAVRSAAHVRKRGLGDPVALLEVSHNARALARLLGAELLDLRMHGERVSVNRTPFNALKSY